MWAIETNSNYFKPNILKFKAFIYKSNSKVIYKICIYGGNTTPVGGKVTPPSRGGHFLPLIFLDRTTQNTQN